MTDISFISSVGAIFNFGRSRMFGPDKFRSLVVGRSRRIKKRKTYVIKVLISNHSNYIGEFYKNLIKKGPVFILRDNTIVIHINLIQSKVAPV